MQKKCEMHHGALVISTHCTKMLVLNILLLASHIQLGILHEGLILLERFTT